MVPLNVHFIWFHLQEQMTKREKIVETIVSNIKLICHSMYTVSHKEPKSKHEYGENNVWAKIKIWAFGLMTRKCNITIRNYTMLNSLELLGFHYRITDMTGLATPSKPELQFQTLLSSQIVFMQIQ